RSSSFGSGDTPIHTTRGRRKFGKAPTSATSTSTSRCRPAIWPMAVSSCAAISPDCSPKNLSVRWRWDARTHERAGAASRSGAVASNSDRRSSGAKLIARNSRTTCRVLVFALERDREVREAVRSCERDGPLPGVGVLEAALAGLRHAHGERAVLLHAAPEPQ